MKELLNLTAITLACTLFVGCASNTTSDTNTQKAEVINKQTRLNAPDWRDKHFKPNYDESKVAPYTLPNVLANPQTGSVATTCADWQKNVAPTLQETFQSQIYGYVPPAPEQMELKTLEEGDAFDGLATRIQTQITVKDKNGIHKMMMLTYIPKSASAQKPAPCFVSMNFWGNHTTTKDPNVLYSYRWLQEKSHPENRVARASQERRWPLPEILKRGYAVSTVYYGDAYPDDETIDTAKDSIYRIFTKEQLKSNPTAYGGWVWGMQRMMDASAKFKSIDAQKLITVGHSRLGKTSLLTAALDPRVSIAISSCSGCMGDALSRRNFGETPKFIAWYFPYWFADNFYKYVDNPSSLPVDQHQLLALIAPRPIYISCGSTDNWADQKGELLGLIEAKPVYALYNKTDFPTLENLNPDKPFAGSVGFHKRVGGHDVLIYDWLKYCDFADNFFGKSKK